MSSRCPSVLALVCALASFAGAQWTSDAATNSSLVDGGSDQSQPKVVAAHDGGTWLSWFDGIGTGWDVRVQKLDGTGAEVFPHNGLLVADRGFSSTQDYGLAAATDGDALLVFRDDSVPGTQISANRVSDAGALEWGASGVQLTSTGAFVAAPKIAAASDGGAFVAWTQDATVRVQRLSPAGATLWVSDVVLTPGGGTYSVADLHTSGDGALLSFVHQLGGFGSPRRLLAQRFDATGALAFGPAHVAVFDTGSLQFGNFPGFTPDGSGGGVFAWYDTSSFQLQCYAQHILVDGTEAYPHNGVAVSTNATRIRVSPWAAHDPSTGESTVAWVEQDSTQSQSGVAAQRFDAAGNRLWGAQGMLLVPLGADSVTQVRAVASGTSSLIVWASEPSFGNDTLQATRLSAAGAVELGTFDVASTASQKSRLVATRSTWGDSVLAWADDRVDAGDIFGQNVRCDGALGAITPGAAWTDLGGALDGTLPAPTLSGSGTLCPATTATLSLSGALPAASAFLVLGLTELDAPFKGGTLVPNPDVVIAGLPTGAGGFDIPLPWPAAPTSGLVLAWQVWVVDAGGPVGFSASNGLRSTAP